MHLDVIEIICSYVSGTCMGRPDEKHKLLNFEWIGLNEFVTELEANSIKSCT